MSSFTAPDWVLVTAQGPNSVPAPNTVIGRYAFAVYDEGGLINMNLGGFPTYASLTLPTLPGLLRLLEGCCEVSFGRERNHAGGSPVSPGFTPDHINASLTTGVPFSLHV